MPSTTVTSSSNVTSGDHPEVKVTSNNPENDLEKDLASAVASLSLEKVSEPLSKAKNDLSEPKVMVKTGENDLGSSDEDNNKDEEAIVGLNDLSGTGSLACGAEVKRSTKVRTNEEEEEDEDEDEESGTYTSKGNL